MGGIERRRSEAYQRLDRLRSERETLEMRAVELAEQARELSARLSGLRSDKQSSAERKAQLEQDLVRLRGEQREAEQRTEEVRSELSDRRSRLRSLEQLQQRFEGVGAGVRTLMQRATSDASLGVLGMLADRLDCPSSYTQALAGALGDRLQYVVVQHLEQGLLAVQSLRDQKKGRATIIAQNPRARSARGETPSGEGVIGSLVPRVMSGASLGRA